jgi:hypothetical protein
MEVIDQFHVPEALLPGESDFGTHWLGDSVDIRVGLEAMD